MYNDKYMQITVEKGATLNIYTVGTTENFFTENGTVTGTYLIVNGTVNVYGDGIHNDFGEWPIDLSEKAIEGDGTLNIYSGTVKATDRRGNPVDVKNVNIYDGGELIGSKDTFYTVKLNITVEGAYGILTKNVKVNEGGVATFDLEGPEGYVLYAAKAGQPLVGMEDSTTFKVFNVKADAEYQAEFRKPDEAKTTVKVSTATLEKTYDGKPFEQTAREALSYKDASGGAFVLPAGREFKVEFETYSYSANVATAVENKVTVKVFEGDVDVSDKYEILYDFGTIAINPADLTVSFEAATTTYGSAAPEFTPKYTGFVNNETAAVLTGTLAAACDYEVGNPIGEYDIVPSGFGDEGSLNGNYKIAYENGKLTVNKLSIILITESGEWAYDGEEHKKVGLSFADGSLLYAGDELTIVEQSWKSVKNVSDGEIRNAPTYDIVRKATSESVKTNYDITENFGTLKITKAEIVLQVNDKEIPFGDEPSNDGAKYLVKNEEGEYVESETVPELVQKVIDNLSYYYPTYQKGCSVTGHIDANGTVLSYAIKANVTAAQAYLKENVGVGNYDFVCQDGELIVSKRQISIAPANNSIVYGEAAPATAAEGEELLVFTNWSGSDSEAGVTVDGEENKETVALDKIKLSYTKEDGGDVSIFDVGKYVISIDIEALPELTNYYFEYVYDDPNAETPTKVTAELEVTKKEITITADDGEWTYDGKAHTKATWTVDPTDGIVTANGDVLNCVITGSVKYVSDTAEKNNVVTSYTILRNGVNVSGNYEVETVAGNLSIKECDITVTAESIQRVYDGTDLTLAYLGENPWFKVTTGTLGEGDVAAVDTSDGSIRFAGTADSEVKIKISDANGADVTENYDIEYVKGVLKVTERDITIKAKDGSFVYDGIEHTQPEYTQTGLAETDTLTLSMTADSKVQFVTDGEVVNTIDPETVSMKNTEDDDATTSYNITLEAGTLKVLKRQLTLKGYKVEDKTYDGTTKATVNLDDAYLAFGEGTEDDKVYLLDLEAEKVALKVEAAFVDKNAGEGKTVNVTVALEGDLAGNYEITNASFTETADIEKAEITVTPNEKTINYGEGPANDGYVMEGFIGEETEETISLTGTVAYKYNYKRWDNIYAEPDYTEEIDYTISVDVSGLSSTNYTFTAGEDAKLTVKPVNMDVTIVSSKSVYDDTNNHYVKVTVKVPTADYPGLGDIVIEYSDDNGTTWSTENFYYHDAMAEKTILVRVTDKYNNYNVFNGSGTVEITKKDLVIKARDWNIEYGDPSPVWDVTALEFSGFEGDDTYRDLAGTLVISCEYVPFENDDVNKYPIAASGYLSNNYNIIYEDGLLTIGLKDLYIYIGELVEKTSDDGKERFEESTTVELKYGDILDLDAVKYYGFIEGEGPEVLEGTLAALSTYNPYTFNGETSEGYSEIGNYTVVFSGLTSENYAIHFVLCNVKVAQKEIRVTPNELSKVYGDEDPELTFTTDMPLVGTDKFIGALERTAGEDVGKYAINKGNIAIVDAEGNDIGKNYSIYFVEGKDFEITQRDLTITADDKQVTYGDAIPEYTFTANGFQFDDSIADLQGTLKYTCSYRNEDVAENRKVGTYAIVLSGIEADNGNYNVTLVDGTLTVVEAEITLTADPKETVYGSEAPEFTVALTAGSFKYDDKLSDVDIEFTCEYDITNPEKRNVGEYDITFTAALDNYTITTVGNKLTVVPKRISIDADAQEVTYGDEAPEYTVTGTGFAYDDDEEDITVDITCDYRNPDDADHRKVGTYDIIINSAENANYIIATSNNVLTVEAKAIDVKLENATIKYGDDEPKFEANVVTENGLQYTDTIEDLKIVIDSTYDKEVAANRVVGTYAISATYDNDNYIVTFNEDAVLTVEKLKVTVTADDTPVIYGDDAVFTEQFNTLVYDETVEDLNKIADYACDYDKATANAGETYAIEPEHFESDNYEFEYVQGTLTVEKAPLKITALPQEVEYGDPLDAFTVTYEGFKNDDDQYNLKLVVIFSCDYTVGSGVTTEDRHYYLTPSLSEEAMARLANYDVEFVKGEITVVPAKLVVVFEDKQIAYGDEAPEFTFTIDKTMFKNGENLSVITPGTITTNYEVGDSKGKYDIFVDPSDYFKAENYVFEYTDGKLTVTAKKVTVTIVDKEIVYGDAAPEYTVTVDSYYGDDSFEDLGIKLSCEYVQGDDAGEYAIKAATTEDYALKNYEFVLPEDGTLTVAKAQISIKADDKTAVYGEIAPEFTYTVTDGKFTNGETLADVIFDASCDYDVEDAANRNVGEYPITFTATLDNYDITVEDGTLTITPKKVTVKVTVDSITYGDDVPAQDDYTAVCDELVYEDDIDDLKLVFSTEYEKNDGVAEYAISATYDNDNYDVTFDYGKLVVEKKALTVTPDDISLVYGQTEYDFTAAYEGFIDGEDESVLGGELTFSCDFDVHDPAKRNVGEYTITCAGLTSDNYAIEFKTGTLTVTKAKLVITADDFTEETEKAIFYGAPIPNYTYTTEGFVYGEDEFSLRKTVIFVCDYQVGSGIGNYPIKVSLMEGTDSLTNYDVEFVEGLLVVKPVTLTIKFAGDTKTYGDDASEYEVIGVEGFVNGETEEYLIALEKYVKGHLECAYEKGDDAGEYEIIPVGYEAANYIFTWEQQYLVVEKKVLDVTVDDISVPYGSEIPEYTFKITGFVLDQDESVLDLTTAVFAGYEKGYHVTEEGYKISVSGLTDKNYDFNYIDGTLTVTPVALKVTAEDKTVTYGDAAPEYTVTYEGFVLDEDETVLGGTLGFDCEYAAGSTAAKTYAITPKGLESADYTITFVPGTLTVNKAALTVTAEDKTVTYGDDAPVYTASFEGFVLEENESVLGGTATFECEYTVGSTVTKTYPISVSGYTSDDYEITYVGGTLTVLPKKITVTADSGLTKVYGSDDPALTYTTDVAAVGSDTFVLYRAEGEDVGEYEIMITEDPNYEITFVSSVLTITPKALVVIPTEATKVYGEADPVFEYTAYGFEFDDDESLFTGAVSRVEGEDVGTYALTIGTLSAGINYTINFAEDVVLTITPADLKITAENKSITYGDDAPEFTAKFEGLVNGDTEEDLDGELVFACEYAKLSNAGTYDIEVSGLTSGNYTITFVKGTLSVGKASIDLTAAAENVSILEASAQKLKIDVSGNIVSEIEDGKVLELAVILNGAEAGKVSNDAEGKFAVSLADLTAGKCTIKVTFAGNENYNAAESEEIEVELVELEYTFTTGDINTVTGIETETEKATVAEHLEKAIPGSEVTIGEVDEYVGTGIEITVDGTTYYVLILGDVNGDGSIGARDIASIQKYILEIETIEGIYALAANINGDAAINSRDISAIQRIILG